MIEVVHCFPVSPGVSSCLNCQYLFIIFWGDCYHNDAVVSRRTALHRVAVTIMAIPVLTNVHGNA